MIFCNDLNLIGWLILQNNVRLLTMPGNKFDSYRTKFMVTWALLRFYLMPVVYLIKFGSVLE